MLILTYGSHHRYRARRGIAHDGRFPAAGDQNLAVAERGRSLVRDAADISLWHRPLDVVRDLHTVVAYHPRERSDDRAGRLHPRDEVALRAVALTCGIDGAQADPLPMDGPDRLMTMHRDGDG